MQTECSAERSMFGRVEGRSVVAEFDGGALTSDAGGLLLGAADQRLGLVRRIARCFRDARDPRLVEHSVATLIGQRVFGIALGYEDLNDHDELRHDPLMAVLAGKLEARREDCAPVAGKSTLNRLELSRETPRSTARSPLSPRRSRPCSSTCCSRRTTGRPSRSSSTSTPPTTPCTAIRKAASSTAPMIATATCLFTCSAAGISWRPSSGPRTSTPAPVRLRKSRASSRRSGGVGRERASCCAPTPGSPARR
jgi:Transposase DDE domain group 1